MSHSVSRRQFLHGLGIVAAAAALSACSASNEDIIAGPVGGIVTTDAYVTCIPIKKYDPDRVEYKISSTVSLKNTTSQIGNIGGDNFVVTLDGTPIVLSDISVVERREEDFEYSRSIHNSTVDIAPGEEHTFKLSYMVSKPFYDNWRKEDHIVTVTFTYGGQRVTYTGNSHETNISVGKIEKV